MGIISNPLDFLRELFDVKDVPRQISGDILPVIDMTSGGWVGAEYIYRTDSFSNAAQISEELITAAESDLHRYTLWAFYMLVPATITTPRWFTLSVIDQIATIFQLGMYAYPAGIVADSALVHSGYGTTTPSRIHPVPHLRGIEVPKGSFFRLWNSGAQLGGGTTLVNALWVKNSWGAPKPNIN